LKYDLTVAGYIVLDYISRGRTVTGPLLGGPSTYASLAARALGASVAVVSRVGHDFGRDRLEWFRKRGVTTSHIRVCDTPTTSFKIHYRNGDRTMRVDPVCERLNEEDLETLPNSSSVHIGPVIQEVPSAVALSLRARADVMSVDPQGYVRKRLRDGTIRKKSWNASLLRKTDVLKISESEVTGILGAEASARRLLKLGPRVILLTRGRRGVTVISREEGEFYLPSFKTRVKDPTGAGDALAGAFLVSWRGTEDLLWAAALGGAVASFVVEELGPGNFGTEKQIRSRAKAIFEQTKRLN
jgi:sugar/nucleoside kinase (ribokinase family)